MYNKNIVDMNKPSIIDTAVLKDKLQEYAIKVGRISARPLLLLYFIMVSKDTPKSDKLMILSTLSYLVFSIDLISAKRLPVIGWIDEAFSLSVAYQKVSKNITPEIERKTDALLDKWFPEYRSIRLKSKQRVKHNNIEHNYGSKNKIFRASRFYLA